MAEKKPQTFANHARFDPLFHFFALPVLAFSAVWSAVHFIRHPEMSSGVAFVALVAAVVVTLKARLYSLKIQDRVIRLEERLRLVLLVSEPLRARIPELTEGQLVGLRFASDAELPALCEQALAQKLSRSDIKKAIKNWRPDYWRV
jgi:hypothetical protein